MSARTPRRTSSSYRAQASHFAPQNGATRDKPRGRRLRSASSRRLPVIHETSAGGVVVRKLRGRWHVALLKTRHRRGEVWVLPKGHVEHHQSETKDAAAVREVREELGIAKVRVVRKLGTVRWQFIGEREKGDGEPQQSRRSFAPLRTGSEAASGGRRTPNRISTGPRAQPVRIVKTVHHYLMEGLTERLTPQASEGFLAARWVPYAEALALLAYPTDRAIVRKVLERRRERERDRTDLS